jgi:hypothetical protein
MKEENNHTTFRIILILILLFFVIIFIGQKVNANDQESKLSIIIINESKLTASDGEHWDHFGNSLSISDDTMVVGAIYADGSGQNGGAAYVFERVQDGLVDWVEVTQLDPSAYAYDGRYGNSVAISVDTIVVGGQWTRFAESQHGYTYLFERNYGGTNNWGEVKVFSKPEISDADTFGISVAIDGDILVISDPSDETLGYQSGAAYIYERNLGGENNWGEVAKIFASDGEESDLFGSSVDVSGDTIIIGASREDGIGNDRGAVYVYERNQGGQDRWGEVAKLSPLTLEDDEYFGISLAINDQNIVVGSDKYGGLGSVFVFNRDEGGSGNWGQIKNLIIPYDENIGYFPMDVSISENFILVGCSRDADVVQNQGAVYIYERDLGGSNNWGELTKLTAYDKEIDDQYGNAVSIDNNTLAVGATREGDMFTRPGAVYVYRLSQGHKIFLPMMEKNN